MEREWLVLGTSRENKEAKTKKKRTMSSLRFTITNEKKERSMERCCNSGVSLGGIGGVCFGGFPTHAPPSFAEDSAAAVHAPVQPDLFLSFWHFV